MKHAALDWVHKAKRQFLEFKLVTWPHDEWQTEVRGQMKDAELLGKIQRQSIVDTGVKFGMILSLIHIRRCRRPTLCNFRWSPDTKK